MDVNVKGVMLMSQASVPFWRAQGSRRHLNYQLRGLIWAACVTRPWSAKKRRSWGSPREMAIELGPIGVRSNAVAPSFVLTPFNDQRRDLTTSRP
jgi:NAD(P)-dependent dehydrogenase (short-subunit alcohol dehydrogenase family)